MTKLSTRRFWQNDLTQGEKDLSLSFFQFRRECPELHDFLDASEVGTIFALPWLITWFSHVLPNYQDVVRLFDFFLAQPASQALQASGPEESSKDGHMVGRNFGFGTPF